MEEEKRKEENGGNNRGNESLVPSIASANTLGRKYFVSATNNSRILTFFVDSGADISIFPTRLAAALPAVLLDEPLEVRGFDGIRRFEITHRVDLSLDFSPGDLRASFFLGDVPHPIIRADLLQDESKSLSLETGKGLLRVGNDLVLMKPTSEDAIKELKRRRK